jgi:non-ribosomal peptide synthetase component F
MPSGSADLYVAILGVLAAGAAYVPVDADDPAERADLVFAAAGVAAVLGQDDELGPSSLVLRGDQVPAGSRWTGNLITPWM